MTRTLCVQGTTVPSFLYGTAWKEDATEALVHRALRAGFRGIDTANQRKHYFEEGVGDGIQRALDEGLVTRADLFLQTKFTYQRGQDHRVPYDPSAPLRTQVEQSFTRSLQHLRVDTLDSVILHGPWKNEGWHDEDREVWGALESLRKQGRLRLLGISAVGAEQLQTLVAEVGVAPAFVQNRCYANRGWDGDVRALCREHGILYQAFSLLTANRAVVESESVGIIADRHGVTPSQVVFAFARGVGMLPLTGTSKTTHMQQDLAALDLELTPDELDTVERAS
jgi:diketogulonate reductase-like aldo/keto reductase